MSRKVIIMLAAICVVFTGASFAAVESIKVSGDITATAVNRDLGLGGDGSGGALSGVENAGHGNLDAEHFAFSQVRIRFDADLTEGVSAVVRLINERAWGSEDADNNNPLTITQGGDTEVDVDLAYVEMKEFLYQPLTLIIGRQNLRYGNALLIGDPDTNQTASVKVPRDFADQSLRKSFDAVRAILDYSPYTVDLIYAALDENVSNINDDRNLWGAYATYDWASYNGVSEAYFLYTNQNASSILGSPALVNPTLQIVEDQSATYTMGGRVQYDPNDNWTLGIEGAYQFGDIQILDNTAAAIIATNPYQHLSAFAAQLIGQYRFLNDYNSMLQLEYTYLSGDNDKTDELQTGWQPLFEDQTAGELINILFPNTGTQAITLRGSMMPREDITVGASYTWLTLAEKVNYDYDTVLTAEDATTYNSVVGPAAGNTYNIEGNENYLGSEIDSFMLYDYTEDVQIKLTSAVFIPGGFFQSENNTAAYSMKAGVSVDF
jgi:alginate export protein